MTSHAHPDLPTGRRPRTRRWIGPGAGLLLLAIIVATLAGSLPVRAEAVTDDELNIRILAPAEQAAAVREVAHAITGRLRALLGDRLATTPRVNLTLTRAQEPPTGPLDLTLPENTTLGVTTFALAGVLLKRQALQLQNGQTAPIESLDWLAAALTFRVVFGVTDDYSWVVKNRQLARGLYGRGVCPELPKLLAGGIDPAWSLPFELYSRQCHVLLIIVERNSSRKDNRISHLLTLLAAGRAPASAFQSAYQECISGDATLQAWYEQEYLRLAAPAGKLTQCNLDELVERVHELETVPVVGAAGTGSFQAQRVPLDELDQKLADYQLDHGALNTIGNEFFTLFRRAPWCVQPALTLYVQAVLELNTGHNRKFRSDFRKARQTFATAVDRQAHVNAWLDRLENEVQSTALTWAPVFAATAENRRQQQALAPAISAFLDKLAER